jgi:type IV secretory pathway VirD2 relaxase
MSARISKAPQSSKRGPSKGDGHEAKVGRTSPAPSRSEVAKLQKTLSITSYIAQQRYASKRQTMRTAAKQRQMDRESKRSLQRAAVRITYSAPKTAQHWRAHGVYIQREAAISGKDALFTESGATDDIAGTLAGWQKAGDKRLFRLIISPEMGARLDMKTLTKETMQKLEKELGTKLEWVAAVHTNTDHPHVHVALRGVTDSGQELKIPKQTIRTSIREYVEEAATRQIGFRSEQEIDAATVQEAYKQRVTSLDKAIASNGLKTDKTITFDTQGEYMRRMSLRQPVKALAIERRLETLASMGFATRVSGTQWSVSDSFMTQIKNLAQVGDRQRMLSRHMAPASSVGQEIQNGNWNDVQHLNARILGHDEDEETGKRYMLVEATDGRIIQLPHRKDIEAMRADGKLKRDELITVGRKHGRLTIKEHGNAYQAINDPYVIAQMRDDYTGKAEREGWLKKFDDASEVKHVVFTASQLETVLGATKGRTQEEAQTASRLIVAREAVPIDDEQFATYSETQKGYVVTAPALNMKTMVQVVQHERSKQKRDKDIELERDI